MREYCDAATRHINKYGIVDLWHRRLRAPCHRLCSFAAMRRPVARLPLCDISTVRCSYTTGDAPAPLSKSLWQKLTDWSDKAWLFSTPFLILGLFYFRLKFRHHLFCLSTIYIEGYICGIFNSMHSRRENLSAKKSTYFLTLKGTKNAML